MRFTRTRLCVLGAALTAAMMALAAIDGRRDAILFLAVTGAASAAYGLAAWTVLKAAPETTRGLWLCLALAVACRVPLVLAEPTISDDIYRYIWDGRIQGLGYSPYTSAPGDAALQHLHSAVTRRTGHPTLPTIYPPGAEWFFRGVAAVSQSVFAFKLAFVGCDLLIAGLLLRWLARVGQSPWRVLVYAWNPLVIIEVAGSGHLDILGALLLFVSFLALSNRWPLFAALAFVAAVEVKVLPIVLAPLFWRRVRIRDIALAGVFGLALAAPFLFGHAEVSAGSLPTYLEKWRFNGPAFAFVERFAQSRWLVSLPALTGLALAVGLRSRHPVPAAWAWPMAGAALLMPAVYPWYLLWLVPFLGAIETVPLLVWTQSSLLTYFVWHVVARGGPWELPGWVLAIEFGSVMVVAAWLGVRHLRRAEAPVVAPGGAR